jgi:hypothetical protein
MSKVILFRSILLCSLFAVIFVNNTFAQGTATAAPEEAKEEEKASEAPFEISGFIDGYYLGSFKNTPFPTSFTPENKSFSLGMANIILTKTGKVGFVADLAVGPRAELANFYTGTALSFIKQLFVTYSPSDKLLITMGNYSTHHCYEVIDSKTNFHYSTSYVFTNGPFFHTGIKANYAISDKFGLMLGVFNDTDTKIDIVSGKHLGAQLSYITGKLSSYLNFTTGKSADIFEKNPEEFSTQIDLSASYSLSEKVGLGLNISQKSVEVSGGETANWQGLVLYGKYLFNDSFTLGVRGERFIDKYGLITGIENNAINAFTLSGNIRIGNLTLIPEFRMDFGSKDKTFTSLDALNYKSISGLLMAVVYSF